MDRHDLGWPLPSDRRSLWELKFDRTCVYALCGAFTMKRGFYSENVYIAIGVFYGVWFQLSASRMVEYETGRLSLPQAHCWTILGRHIHSKILLWMRRPKVFQKWAWYQGSLWSKLLTNDFCIGGFVGPWIGSGSQAVANYWTGPFSRKPPKTSNDDIW